MALDATVQEKAVGQANFDRVAEGLTRREFMKSLALTGGVLVPISAAVYFGYHNATAADQKPVRAALVGAGDEGGVLIGEHNPKFLEIVAVSDIRPDNKIRIFEDEQEKQKRDKKAPDSPRRGLKHHYGTSAPNKIKTYGRYEELLAAIDNKEIDIEAVVIALPLHLHAPAAIEFLKRKKHVLCEKLMAWNISECKRMIKAAEDNDVILSIGHQRHYSLLYAHALDLIQTGVLGEMRHIRALWHRNNAQAKTRKEGDREIEIPGVYKDSWKKNPLDPNDMIKDDKELKAKWDELQKNVKQLGYKSMEELVNWRLFKRTGGGLMAELGSHQLDACSIFLGKQRPLAVTGVGGKFFYKDDREVEDHVFCTFEFPGPNFFENPKEPTRVRDRNDVIVVTYSSISTNGFEPYGECLMGSKGTLVVEKEQSLQLYSTAARSTELTVTAAGAGKPALETSGSGSGGAKMATSNIASGAAGGISRGYREEMEHFAFCIRQWNQSGSKGTRPQVRCTGKVAMQDAIIALTANLSMDRRQRVEFIDIEKDGSCAYKKWFDADSLDVPDPEKKIEVVTG